MPFQAASRCPFVSIKLNVCAVCEDLETILDKDYNEDISKGTIFWGYVELLEDGFSVAYSRDPNLNFWEWLPDNYNNVEYWDQIEDNFKDREEDTSDEEEEYTFNVVVPDEDTSDDDGYTSDEDEDEDFTFNVEEYMKNKN